MRVPMRINVLKGITLFGLLGPFIGLLALALTSMAATDDWSIRSILFLAPAAYIVGGIPAIICGFAAGLTRTRFSRLPGSIVAGSVGSALSLGYYCLVSIRRELDSAALLFAVMGFVSGLTCGAFFFAPPNNSFKPTQLRGGNILRLVRSYLPPLRRSA